MEGRERVSADETASLRAFCKGTSPSVGTVAKPSFGPVAYKASFMPVISHPPVPPSAAEPAAATPKQSFRLIETALASLSAESEEVLLCQIAERIAENFGDMCGIRGWEVGDALRLDQPQGSPVSPNVTVNEREGLVTWDLRGQRRWHVVFKLGPDHDESTLLVLQLARAAAQQRLTESGWHSLLDRARAIQQSLLPKLPFDSLLGFDVHGRSDPSDVVGGDVFDVRSLDGDACSLLLADASGHGFPAALQARDVVIGLRMGHDRHLKLAATIAKLNAVLCDSTLSSQFVSLIYGELSADGEFQYVNAGHPSPVLFTGGRMQFLPQTGPVLGVSPRSRYRLEHVVLPPDSVLVLYSDGVVETLSPEDEEFGLERLVATCLKSVGEGAYGIAESVFAALDAYRGTMPIPDDATVLVIRRRR